MYRRFIPFSIACEDDDGGKVGEEEEDGKVGTIEEAIR
tara:strand:+ start:314 stop:427 length:114 start_codon:yes stop_codon:yes gene_type:complete